MNSEGTTGESQSPRDLRLKLGGLMTIGAGLLSLQSALTATVFGGELPVGVDFERFAMCTAMVTIFGIVAIAGGVCALVGRHLSLALAGAFLGMISGGLISFWLGLGALVVFAFANADL